MTSLCPVQGATFRPPRRPALHLLLSLSSKCEVVLVPFAVVLLDRSRFCFRPRAFFIRAVRGCAVRRLRRSRFAFGTSRFYFNAALVLFLGLPAFFRAQYGIQAKFCFRTARHFVFLSACDRHFAFRPLAGFPRDRSRLCPCCAALLFDRSPESFSSCSWFCFQAACGLFFRSARNKGNRGEAFYRTQRRAFIFSHICSSFVTPVLGPPGPSLAHGEGVRKLVFLVHMGACSCGRQRSQLNGTNVHDRFPHVSDQNATALHLACLAHARHNSKTEQRQEFRLLGEGPHQRSHAAQNHCKQRLATLPRCPPSGANPVYINAPRAPPGGHCARCGWKHQFFHPAGVHSVSTAFFSVHSVP